MKTNDLVYHPRFGVGKLLSINKTLCTIPFASVEYDNKQLYGVLFRPLGEFEKVIGQEQTK